MSQIVKLTLQLHIFGEVGPPGGARALVANRVAT